MRNLRVPRRIQTLVVQRDGESTEARPPGPPTCHIPRAYAMLTAPSVMPQLQQIAHYRVDRLIGAGGMGEVYLAHDDRLRRKVALKLLPARFTMDEERVRRFQREARSASALNHPNIITIHDIGEADGIHYIATEFIDGATLREKVAQRQMTIAEVLDVGIGVAGALAAAHEAGIIHRDIKPENVMIRHDGYGTGPDFWLATL